MKLLCICVGAVRAESFTRLPPPLYPASMTDPHLANAEGTECVPNTTTDQEDDLDIIIANDEEEEELLQKLTTRHYYSYTAALGVTVGVGCLLLMLNMLIFAGIYYQRERDRKRTQSHSSRSPSSESIPMSQRPSPPCGSSRQSPIMKKDELPPCYSVLSKAISEAATAPHNTNTLRKEKPQPPVRTSSNLSGGGGTVKKRVQIQEISV